MIKTKTNWICFSLQLIKASLIRGEQVHSDLPMEAEGPVVPKLLNLSIQPPLRIPSSWSTVTDLAESG